MAEVQEIVLLCATASLMKPVDLFPKKSSGFAMSKPYSQTSFPFERSRAGLQEILAS